MNLKLIVPTLAVACLGVTANAALLGSESFDVGGAQYSLGLVGGQNPANAFFSGAWFAQSGADAVNVVGTGLTWPGLQTSGGALASGPVARAGRNLATAWDNNTAGTYYISFLASYGVGGSHHRVVEAWSVPNPLGSDNFRSLQVGASGFTGVGTGGNTLALSINNNGGGMADFMPSVTIPDGDVTHLFVLRFDLQNSPNSDVVYGYLDPTDLVNEPGSPSVFLAGFDFGLASFGAVVNFVFDGAPTGYFDELRFGTTYADVLPAAIPEPTTFSLLGLGGLGLIMAIRRKRA
jgi:hypothetical protein